MTTPPPPAPAASAPLILVVGNEKGGSGKSTVAMHLAVALLRDGQRVATLDLDAGQGTLSRYVANRQARRANHDAALPVPTHEPLLPSTHRDRMEGEADEAARLDAAIQRLAVAHDTIVIDTPGAATSLSRLGHARADTLVTPINDSFIDLDLLAELAPDNHEIIRPSRYADMVWQTRMRRAQADRGTVDWIVMRNRLSALEARNKRDIAEVLERLQKRLGFRLAAGFGERVIFRELFLKGLTLLDLKETEGAQPLTMSQVAARQEVRNLIATIADVPETIRRRRPRVQAGAQTGTQAASQAGGAPVQPPPVSASAAAPIAS